MMTLEEQKLAVCEKLPDSLIHRKPNGQLVWGDSYELVSWPTEGLQVCHEAEKLMMPSEWVRYLALLIKSTKLSSVRESYTAHATYEQRLQALCRVWWPERFV